ncbi:MAG: hypothetical protein AB1405_06480 [Bdellovibrionota bacterium]
MKKNPIPIGGAVVANPLEKGDMSSRPQVEIRLEKGLRATKDPRNPYLVKISQVKYPPAPKKPPPPKQPVPTVAQAARTSSKPAQRKAPSRPSPPRKTPPRPRPSAGVTKPPFTRPSEQRLSQAVRGNPSLFEGISEAAGKIPEPLKVLLLFFGITWGIPAARSLFFKAIGKEEMGADGRPTPLSHAFQIGAAAAAGLIAAKTMKDEKMKGVATGLAVTVALARPINDLIERKKPTLPKLLGEPSQAAAPRTFEFEVREPGSNLTNGLGQEVSDLDTDPVLDAILTKRAAQTALPASPVPELPPAVADPMIAPKGEPLFGEETPVIRSSPKPPDFELGFPFGALFDGELN